VPLDVDGTFSVVRPPIAELSMVRCRVAHAGVHIRPVTAERCPRPPSGPDTAGAVSVRGEGPMNNGSNTGFAAVMAALIVVACGAALAHNSWAVSRRGKRDQSKSVKIALWTVVVLGAVAFLANL
jgi:hypothetical protein